MDAKIIPHMLNLIVMAVSESAGGLAQSKTLVRIPAKLFECASALALS